MIPTPHPPASTPDLPDSAGEDWLDALDADVPLPPIPIKQVNGAGRCRVDDRPVVKLGVDMHRVVEETAGGLARDPLTFQRAHRLATVVGAPADADKMAPISRGAPMIRDHNPGSILPRLTRFVRMERYVQPSPKAVSAAAMTGKEVIGECKEALPPPTVVTSLLNSGDWQDVRVLVGVTETPLVRTDGTIHQTRGYDASTGYLYAPSRDYPDVPETPTREEAAEALAELAHVFCDFPYVGASAATVPIAAFLTVLARPAIDGPVPAFLFDASVRGSGKTLQADIVSLLATGRSAARATYPEDDAELAKTFLSYALAGCQTVLIDNVTRQLGGGVLDAVLTTRDDIQFRVLGINEAPRIRWVTVLFVSGNNLVLGEDTMRRVLIARLESAMENPEERTTFAHPSADDPRDLFQWVRDERPRLVAAGLTVLRSYTSHGRPDVGCRRWGTFEAWSSLIPPAIVFAGGADPMLSRPTKETMINDDLSAHVTILRELPRLSKTSLSAAEMVRLLYPAPGHDDPPDGWSDLREAIECWTSPRPG